MSAIISVEPLGFPWKTFDPFLFCAHHDDRYPAGAQNLGPAASLAGRRIGMDFASKDGWNMYHGDVVPGFPQHPHRGFETVSLVRHGYVDHHDSLGANARFGRGDVQWMTAGKGVVHSEMFPLLDSKADNRMEMFQVWLNLPASHKMVDPYFTMLWGESMPRHEFVDEQGRKTEVVTVAGALDEGAMPKTPPDSWAADPKHEVAIWTIRLEAGARYRLPAASSGVNRGLYFFDGEAIEVDGQAVGARMGMRLRGDAEVELVAGSTSCELLLLQGRPIDEPVAQHGPFVMNTPEQIQQAFMDYRRTQFGGWPWDHDGPVHGAEAERFAVHADGHREQP